jgi:hypothetical protein
MADWQRKAARRQRAKDDPYYLYDEKDDRKAEMDDVDDIPIVRLDDKDLQLDGEFVAGLNIRSCRRRYAHSQMSPKHHALPGPAQNSPVQSISTDQARCPKAPVRYLHHHLPTLRQRTGWQR